MADSFDLVVIGCGPAGEHGAAHAAHFGKRVCIIERAPKPGGAAVNTGTIPSNTLRETALHFAGLRRHRVFGIDYTIKRDITVGDFMLGERSVVEAEWKLIDEHITRQEITQVRGSARFIDAHTVEVTRTGHEPRRISGQHFLIATGSQPRQPEGAAVDGTVIVDSETLLTLDKIPASMIVVGGGVVGCEYASIFAALGVRVTIVTKRRRLLAHLDAEIGAALRQQMTARLGGGISVHVDTEVTSLAVENRRAVVTLGLGDTSLTADCVLFCAGRDGSSRGLGLDAIGVRTNARGFIQVDDQYRTSVPGVYAAGDIVGLPALASTAMEQARVAICHAFGVRCTPAMAHAIPYVVFTIPEIATVGRTEDELRASTVDFECGRAWYRANARGQIIGDLDGCVKLVFNPDTKQLLGAAIVGEGAGELIHIAMACLSFDGTLDFFIESVFTYPSLAETYKVAAVDGLQALARRHAKRTGLPSDPAQRLAIAP